MGSRSIEDPVRKGRSARALKEMNMFGQQRAKNQKPRSQEGIVELSDEQLEDVSGGYSEEDLQRGRNRAMTLVKQGLQDEYQARLQGGTTGNRLAFTMYMASFIRPSAT